MHVRLLRTWLPVNTVHPAQLPAVHIQQGRLTLRARHSNSNTAADWSGAGGPSPETTADRAVGAS